MSTASMTSPAFQVILFDLGGVLVHFDGIAPLLTLSGNNLDREDARVDTARLLGFSAHQARGVQETRAILPSLGLHRDLAT